MIRARIRDHLDELADALLARVLPFVPPIDRGTRWPGGKPERESDGVKIRRDLDGRIYLVAAEGGRDGLPEVDRAADGNADHRGRRRPQAPGDQRARVAGSVA